MLKISAPDLTALLRRDAEQCEEMSSDLVTLYSFGYALAGQIGIPAVHGREVIECLVLLGPVAKVRGGRFDVVRILLGNGFVYHRDAIEIRKSKWPEEQGIYVAEYRSVSSDTQRQRDHRQRCDAGALAHHAQSVDDILK